MTEHSGEKGTVVLPPKTCRDAVALIEKMRGLCAFYGHHSAGLTDVAIEASAFLRRPQVRRLTPHSDRKESLNDN